LACIAITSGSDDRADRGRAQGAISSCGKPRAKLRASGDQGRNVGARWSNPAGATNNAGEAAPGRWRVLVLCLVGGSCTDWPGAAPLWTITNFV